MKNLAKDRKATITVANELQAAGLIIEFDIKLISPIHTKIYGSLGNLTFKRQAKSWLITGTSRTGKKFSDVLTTQQELNLFVREFQALGLVGTW